MKAKPLDAYRRNFRDLSYLQNEEGLHLLPHLFFRSSKLYHLSSSEAAFLKEMGIKTIIDLRTPGEIAKKPDVEIPGVTNIALPILSQEMLGITHERGLKAYKKPPVMRELYASLIYHDDSLSALSKALHIIFDIERTGSILWHCTAGKDRVGLLTAFFLAALGYSRDAIVEDYTRSNQRCEKQGKAYRAGVFILKFDTKLAQAVYESMLAIPDYIDAAFDAVNERFGDMKAFLHDGLHLDEDLIARFKDKYMH